MATVTTTRNVLFTWPDDFHSDFGSDQAFAVCEAKNPNPFKKLLRSKSVGPIEQEDGPNPPPRKSKSVHFADSKGLALVSVMFYNAEKELQDEFSRYMSLRSCTTTDKQQQQRQQQQSNPITISSTASSSIQKPSKARANSKLKEIQLLSAKKIAERVDLQKVCLEKTVIQESTIRGFVCVLNLAYEKSVCVRYTFDDWKTQETISAEFERSNTDKVDRFHFEIPIPRGTTNVKVEFAVSYSVPGEIFWDNNNGFNYHVLVA